mmetsp:Transcript_75104/g.135275  ORF Transcript_75104/g.135275 Transcript_75104/m.135275 type:complete len:186 (+) Transcript_75104:59-616(+)
MQRWRRRDRHSQPTDASPDATQRESEDWSGTLESVAQRQPNESEPSAEGWSVSEQVETEVAEWAGAEEWEQVPEVFLETEAELASESTDPPASEKAAVQKHSPQEPCPICMEDFLPAEGMPRTCRKCNNIFHQACLTEWAKKEQQIKWEQKPWLLPSQFESGSCPCCRSSKGHDKSRRWTAAKLK